MFASDCADHGAAAKSHDRHSGCHAGPVGEPFHQGLSTGEMPARPRPTPPITPEPSHISQRADGRKYRWLQEGATAWQRRQRHQPYRAGALEPATPMAADTPRITKNNVYIQPMLANSPVAGCREQFLDERNVGTRLCCRHTERARQRQPEHRKAVGHTDAEMDAERRRRHQPAIEPFRGDDAFAIQDAGCRHSGGMA